MKKAIKNLIPFLIVFVAIFVASPALAKEAKASQEGAHFATLFGNALISTATPVTKASEITVSASYSAQVRILTPKATKVKVPIGTTFEVTVTAYTSSVDECDADPFTTASGTRTHDGTLAANFLPFGTRVSFPDYFGDKVFTVEDRTSAKYSSRADVWMITKAEAFKFGKRHLTLVVVE